MCSLTCKNASARSNSSMKVFVLAVPLILLARPVRAEADPPSIADRYRAITDKLIATALADKHNMDRLEYLCDRIGNRLSGSASLERAIEWSAAEMKQAGLANVQTPPVKIPHWVRGKESAILLSPIVRPLEMIGLGMSV